MNIYERIRSLCKLHAITITGLERKLGFAKGSLCRIDKNKPSSERVQKIADYFGVSQTYILTGEMPSGHYHDSESARLAQEMFEDPSMRELFGAKKEIGAERFEAVMNIVRALKERENHVNE